MDFRISIINISLDDAESTLSLYGSANVGEVCAFLRANPPHPRHGRTFVLERSGAHLPRLPGVPTQRIEELLQHRLHALKTSSGPALYPSGCCVPTMKDSPWFARQRVERCSSTNSSRFLMGLARWLMILPQRCSYWSTEREDGDWDGELSSSLCSLPDSKDAQYGLEPPARNGPTSKRRTRGRDGLESLPLQRVSRGRNGHDPARTPEVLE